MFMRIVCADETSGGGSKVQTVGVQARDYLLKRHISSDHLDPAGLLMA